MLPPLEEVPEDLPPRELLAQVLSYLEIHINDRLTLPEICAAFSISRSRLERIFHTEKGCGVIDYFIKMKIDRAKELIRNGAMNITELSYHLSFTFSPVFFSPLQALHRHVTP